MYKFKMFWSLVWILSLFGIDTSHQKEENLKCDSQKTKTGCHVKALSLIT